MKIYLDILFITNTMLTLVFIKCISRLAHIRLTKKRAVISSLTGGASSMLALVTAETETEGLILMLIKITLTALIVAAAFKTGGISEFVKLLFMYIAANLLFAGLCIILWRAGSGRIIFVNSLTVYFDIELSKLVGASVVTYLILTAYEYLQRRSFASNKRYRLLLVMEKLQYSLPAISDTGNTLTDFLNGLPVVIICSDELYYYFSLDSDETALRSGFHAIPYMTISGEGIIYVTQNASVTLIDEEKAQKAVECSVGITRSSGGSKRAIFNPSLII